MKNKKIVLLTMLSLVFVFIFGSTVFAEPVSPTFDEFMMSETDCMQSCIMPCTDNNIQLMSADETHGTDEPKKLLTILIEFKDIKIKYDGESWHKQMYSTKSEDLSVVNYWKENANGLEVFEPYDTSRITDGRTGKVSYENYIDIGYTVTKCPEGIVKVTFDMPHPFATWNKYDSDIEYKIVSLVTRVLEMDLDFYSNKNPHIVTIFAGYEDTSATTEGKGQMHAHADVFGVETSSGINLGAFAVQGELQPFCVGQEYGYMMQGIGTTCHELGHSVFNLPDLYFSSVPPGPSNGISSYSLMSTGCWGRRYDPTDYYEENNYGDPYAKYSYHVPTHLDPWCKIQCGFVTPEIVNEWDGDVNSISDMGIDSKYNVLKVMSKADPKQYFLIENRQLTGFDKGLETVNLNSEWKKDETLFNGGILIYHIDENVTYSNNNNTDKHPFIYIERSNNGTSSAPYPNLWAYLKKDGRNKFNAETVPNSNFHEADNLKICSKYNDCHPQTVKSGISIEILDESSPSMRVKVNVDDEYRIDETNETFSDVFADINFCNAIIEILSEDGKERKANDIISADDWFKILSIETLTISDQHIKSLKGIEYLSKLTGITCSKNELTELDFSNNPELNYIDCKNNKLTKLNVSGCKNLMILYCSNNLLKNLNIADNNELLQLNCSNNELTEINVNGNNKLDRLVCHNNYMDADYTVGIEGVSSLKQSLVTSANNFIYSPQKTADIEISTLAELEAFRDDVNNGNTYEGKTVKLTADIDMSEKYGEGKESWTPIAISDWDNDIYKPFSGTFDGDNHTINGLYINSEERNVALFSHIEGTLKNLNVKGSVSTTNMDGEAAGIAVAVMENASIIDCTFDGTVKSPHYAAGGIAAENFNVISGCIFKGKVEGMHVIGGISSNIDDGAIITNCVNEGEIIGTVPVGGIAGAVMYHSTITNCINKGSVTGRTYIEGYEPVASMGIGGIAGVLETTCSIENCYNTGVISGNTYTGGVLGCLDGDTSETATVKNCYNFGNVTSTLETNNEHYIGGIIGSLLKLFSETPATVPVEAINCYYLLGTADKGMGGTDTTTALTTEQFADKTNFANWDFETVWKMDATLGRPVLRSDTEEPPIETHIHTLVHHAAVAATCTETGTGEYWKCEGTDACNKMFSDANGTTEITEIPTTAATGHTEVTDAAIAATCETDGKTAGSHCSVCQTVIAAQTIIPKLNHNWGAWSISVEPTNETTGKAERICGNDNTHKDNVDLPILTDTSVWTAGARVEPTETENGSQVYTSIYGTVTVILPATGNEYDYSIKYENEKAVVTVPQDGTYTVIFAAYDNGRLLSVNAQDIQLVKGENSPISPQNFNANGKVKVMLWDSLMGMKPLCAADGN